MYPVFILYWIPPYNDSYNLDLYNPLYIFQFSQHFADIPIHQSSDSGLPTNDMCIFYNPWGIFQTRRHFTDGGDDENAIQPFTRFEPG